MTDLIGKLREPADSDVPVRICRLMDDAADTIETLTRERDEAREALKFYADRKNWGDGGFKECPDHDGMHSIEMVMSSVDQDNGKRARGALADGGAQE